MNHHPYEDIIHLPHHTSTTRRRMPMENRAAQFAPFSALTGFENAIDESKRSVEEKYDLDELNRCNPREYQDEDDPENFSNHRK